MGPGESVSWSVPALPRQQFGPSPSLGEAITEFRLRAILADMCRSRSVQRTAVMIPILATTATLPMYWPRRTRTRIRGHRGAGQAQKSWQRGCICSLLYSTTLAAGIDAQPSYPRPIVVTCDDPASRVTILDVFWREQGDLADPEQAADEQDQAKAEDVRLAAPGGNNRRHVGERGERGRQGKVDRRAAQEHSRQPAGFGGLVAVDVAE
jgi:hypothetical protein